MSDESQVDDNTNENEDEGTELDASPELSAEDLLKEVAKLRKEAASRRVKNKDLDAKLSEYEEWKKSQMSDLDRAKAEKAELEQTVLELKQETWRTAAASKAGLDADWADRVQGETKEEMIADAKRLAAALGEKTPGVGSLAGKRGKPVGSNPVQDEDAWLRAELMK
jgi:hypothetical protein